MQNSKNIFESIFTFGIAVKFQTIMQLVLTLLYPTYLYSKITRCRTKLLKALVYVGRVVCGRRRPAFHVLKIVGRKRFFQHFLGVLVAPSPSRYRVVGRVIFVQRKAFGSRIDAYRPTQLARVGRILEAQIVHDFETTLPSDEIVSKRYLLN